MRFFVFCAIIIGAVWIFWSTKQAYRAPEVPEAKTAEALVAQVINSDKAGLRTERKGKDGSRLVITYSLDPWALTAGTTQSIYLGHVRSIVPKVFEKFSDVQVMEIRGTAAFVDQRGQKSTEEAFMVAFFRTNSATINWDNVRDENIMKIADGSSIHPGLLKHLSK